VHNLLILGPQHRNHFPVLLSLLLGLSLVPLALVLEVRDLVLAPPQLLHAFLETPLGLLHEAPELFLLKVNRSDIILGLTPKLQVLLPEGDELHKAPQGLLVVSRVGQLAERQSPACEDGPGVGPLVGEPVVLVLVGLSGPGVVRVEEALVVIIILAVALRMHRPIHI